MKNRILLPVCFLLLGILGSCDNSGRTSISVSDTDDQYKFTAHFDEGQTRSVQRFINRSIEPNGIFASADDRFDIDTELQDHTKFKLKSSPGELIIKLDKSENSPASLHRIKKMCEGIKEVLAGN